MMQPIKYDLYPSEQLSIARNDAHQYVVNISLPVTVLIRQEIENYLTSFNRRMHSLYIFFFAFMHYFRAWNCKNCLC